MTVPHSWNIILLDEINISLSLFMIFSWISSLLLLLLYVLSLSICLLPSFTSLNFKTSVCHVVLSVPLMDMKITRFYFLFFNLPWICLWYFFITFSISTSQTFFLNDQFSLFFLCSAGLKSIHYFLFCGYFYLFFLWVLMRYNWHTTLYKIYIVQHNDLTYMYCVMITIHG